MTCEARLSADDRILALGDKVRAALGVAPTEAIWLRLGDDACDDGRRVDIVTDDRRFNACAAASQQPAAGDAWIRITLVDEGLRGRLVAHVARGSKLRLGDGDAVQSATAMPAEEALGLWASWARVAKVWIEIRADDAPALLTPLERFALSREAFAVHTSATGGDLVEISVAPWSRYPPSVMAKVRGWFGWFNDLAWERLIGQTAPIGPYSYRGRAGDLRGSLNAKLPSRSAWSHITVAAAASPAIPLELGDGWIAVSFDQFRTSSKKAARTVLAAQHAAVTKVVDGQALDDTELRDYLSFWLLEQIGPVARIGLLPVDIRFTTG
jgi:hypothetical protein